MPQVSVGQAAVSALASYLRGAVPPDVTVYDRWPEFGSTLFQPAIPGEPDARAVISILRVGPRRRLGVVEGPRLTDTTPLPSGQVQVTWQIGSFIQDVQLDIWAKTDDDRDDIIARLDSALNVGTSQTIAGAPPDDPVRDGVAVAMDPATGYGGNVDFFLDEPEVDDTPESVQRSEYRATYWGEGRGPFARVVTVPALTLATLKESLYLLQPGAADTWNAAAPTIASVTPSTGVLAGGGTVTIAGTGFYAGAAVTFGGTPATSVVVKSLTSITCVVPGAFAPGPVTVAVTNTNGSSAQLTAGYRYTP